MKTERGLPYGGRERKRETHSGGSRNVRKGVSRCSEAHCSVGLLLAEIVFLWPKDGEKDN